MRQGRRLRLDETERGAEGRGKFRWGIGDGGSYMMREKREERKRKKRKWKRGKRKEKRGKRKEERGEGG